MGIWVFLSSEVIVAVDNLGCVENSDPPNLENSDPLQTRKLKKRNKCGWKLESIFIVGNSYTLYLHSVCLLFLQDNGKITTLRSCRLVARIGFLCEERIREKQNHETPKYLKN